jgi:SHAQKYF class myb-like DNA-binding protein
MPMTELALMDELFENTMSLDWKSGSDSSSDSEVWKKDVCGVVNRHGKPCQRVGQCPFHGKNSSNRLPKEMWNKDEHQRFLEGLEAFGKGKWKEIAKIVGTKDAIQVQTHANRFFLRRKQPSKKRRSIHDYSLQDIENEQMIEAIYQSTNIFHILNSESESILMKKQRIELPPLKEEEHIKKSAKTSSALKMANNNNSSSTNNNNCPTIDNYWSHCQPLPLFFHPSYDIPGQIFPESAI